MSAEGSSGEAEEVGEGLRITTGWKSRSWEDRSILEKHFARKLGGKKIVPPQIPEKWNLERCNISKGQQNCVALFNDNLENSYWD